MVPSPHSQFSSPVIVICSSSRIAHSMFVENWRKCDAEVIEFVSQPCGPRKLAKTLEICCKRQGRRVYSVDGHSDIVEKPADGPTPASREVGTHQPSGSGSSGQTRNEAMDDPAPIYNEPLEDTTDQPQPADNRAQSDVLPTAHATHDRDTRAHDPGLGSEARQGHWLKRRIHNFISSVEDSSVLHDFCFSHGI